jgi:hypothetical protein
MVWPGTGPTTIHGNEIWDSSTPPRRLCHDKSNLGFTVNGGDVFEWTGTSGGLAIVGRGFDVNIIVQALQWVMGKPSGWTRPIGPFKVKLIQDDEFVGVPSSTLDATPMQTVTFGAVGSNSDNRATIKSNVNVVFPTISETLDVVIQRYEIWDSSPTPRRIINRKPGDDPLRDGYAPSFGYVRAGNSVTIPLGDMKFSLGRGDN